MHNDTTQFDMQLHYKHNYHNVYLGSYLPLSIYNKANQAYNVIKHMFSFLKALNSWSNLRVLGSKPLGGTRVNSVFHPFEVGQLITWDSWELDGKK